MKEEDIQKKLRTLKGDEAKREYLGRIFEKEGLLNKDTREALYKTMKQYGGKPPIGNAEFLYTNFAPEGSSVTYVDFGLPHGAIDHKGHKLPQGVYTSIAHETDQNSQFHEKQEGESEKHWIERMNTYEETRNRIKRLKNRGYIVQEGYIPILSPKGEGLADKFRQEREERYSKSSLTTRVSAFIFFIAGISFAVASDFSSTGYAIADTAPSLTSLPALLSVLLAAIGGYLFIKSK